MLSSDDVERFWGVCDDLGYAVTAEQVQEMWKGYVERSVVMCDSELPVSPRILFNIVQDCLKHLEEDGCTVG